LGWEIKNLEEVGPHEHVMDFAGTITAGEPIVARTGQNAVSGAGGDSVGVA